MITRHFIKNKTLTIPNNEIWYTSSDGLVVTPNNTNVFGANIVSNTYKNGKGIITFDGDITSIGNYVFQSCSSLASIEIPNSVTSIGNGAFSRCSALTYVTIPNSVTSIGEYAFYKCSSLTYVTIGNSVTIIGTSAFDECTSLTSVIIGNSVTSIEYRAFHKCSSLTSITIPNSVMIINALAFRYCSSIDSVTIGNSVTNIREYAFSSCTSLTSVTIGNSVISIGLDAFSGCKYLTSITCLATTPPTILSNTFYNVNKSIPLYVPDVEAYLSAAYWNAFTNILLLMSDYELVVNSSDESMGIVLIDVHSKFKSSVTATPNEGYRFVSWTNNGEVVSTATTYTFVATEDLTLVANFEIIPQYTVTIYYDNTMGTISGQGTYYEGTLIELTAIPKEGYSFIGWSDDNVDSVRLYTVTSNIELTAVFDIKMCTVNLTATEGGTVTGSGVYPYGSSIILEAIPGEGYEFYKWSNGNRNSYITMNILNDLDITATFINVNAIIYYTSKYGYTVTPNNSKNFGSNLIDNQYN